MEKSVQNLPTDCKVENKNLASKENKTNPEINKFTPKIQKEVNSWDCSTPSENEKSPEGILNDWDSNSDLQETIVEAFDSNGENGYVWNFESERNKPNIKAKKQQSPIFLASSLDSFCLSNSSFKDKTGPSVIVEKKKESEDDLLLEDFEDHLRESPEETFLGSKILNLELSTTTSDSTSEKVPLNQSEGSPEDTIWMIPESERSESEESTRKLISSSDKENIENNDRFKRIFKKTKSMSDMQKKYVRTTAGSSRSEYLGSQKNTNNISLQREELIQNKKLEIESKGSKENILCEKFHRTRVFFTEFECRTMTIDKDVPDELSSKSSSNGNSNKNVLPEENVGVPKKKLPSSHQKDTRGEKNQEPQASIHVLNDNACFNAADENLSDKIPNEDSSSLEIKELTEAVSETTMKAEVKESWLLFDEAGKYRHISKTEVSMMFNGRSADAVLQGRTEHFIPTSTFTNSKSLKNLICNFEPKESQECIMTEEDTGGDDEFKRLIDLERKVENTLFYIRPERDFTASIRIIPVNAEMIHIWKRNRDGGASNLSFDTDLFSLTHGSADIDIATQAPDNNDSIGPPNYEFLDEDENQVRLEATMKQPSVAELSNPHSSKSEEFFKLLSETGGVLETLSNNFKNLPSRFGEPSRSLAMELSKLRTLLKSYSQSSFLRSDQKQPLQSSSNINTSLLTLKASDKADIESENIIEEETKDIIISEIKDETTSTGSSMNLSLQNKATLAKEEDEEDTKIITVNIYTVEDPPTPNPSVSNKQDFLAKPSLKVVENKLKRLQQENMNITKENLELKKKLKEISHELEKYISNAPEQESNTEEVKETEILKEQVAYLQQEMETLKMLSMDQEETFVEQHFLIREELARTSTLLNEWCTTANKIFAQIRTGSKKLEEIGVATKVKFEESLIQNPEDFSNTVCSYLEETFQVLIENLIFEQALKDSQKNSIQTKGICNLDQVISGYSDLIEQCRQGQITDESKAKVMEDYFAVIMEKASLMEELKILKTENEMLIQSQMEHYEKLKQAMIALKDRQSEVIALESSQKLSEDEKIKLTEVLTIFEEDKKKLEEELLEKEKTIEELKNDLNKQELEMQNLNEKLKAAESEAEKFEKSCCLKDEIINNLVTENNEVLKANGIKENEFEFLKSEISNLEIQNNHLETELASTKTFLNETRKETSDYIVHLENLVSNSQDLQEKSRQKLKEATKAVSRLKNECEVLEKQHQCDVKLFNNTKDELEACKEKLLKISNKLKETEVEQEKWKKKYEYISDSDKEKLEALESLTKEYKKTIDENDKLREKVRIYSKDKEELLAEQKNLINKYGVMSKEIQKLQEKYQNMKSECNNRTDLLHNMEKILKNNFVEYNNRIAGLELNISQILEKIIAHRNDLKGKHTGEDPELKELRRQLSIACLERKELENVVDNYYSLMKRLEKEIAEREKQVDELNMKLSLEQRKALEYEKQKLQRDEEYTEHSKVKLLENQVTLNEIELAGYKSELQKCQTNYENEKKKLELKIVDLKSELKKYQLRTEVLLRNLSNCNKSMNSVVYDKRNGYDCDLQAKKEIEKKDKTILELNETLEKYKAEIKLKDSDLENFKKKSFYQNEELKNLQNKIAKLVDSLSTTNKATELQQKEREEMTEKLFHSIKLLMEERSTRQTIESLALEKEKNYKNQTDGLKNELVLKVKECEILKGTIEDKEKLVSQLQDDLIKMKAEVAALKAQISNYRKNKHINNNTIGDNNLLLQATPNQIKLNTQERLDSCLKELKETREFNLDLRKAEGQYQAKIVRLEDEIRGARLLIKELQGDIRTEKNQKQALKNIIYAAKTEIEKCVISKQLVAVVAERINRHLDLSEISSRDLLSGFRLNDSSIVCT